MGVATMTKPKEAEQTKLLCSHCVEKEEKIKELEKEIRELKEASCS